MKSFLSKFRIIFLFVIIYVLLAAVFVRLMEMQIVNGEEYLKQSVKKTTGVQNIIAPRGEIVDIDGDLVVQNEAGLAVIIEKAFFPTDVNLQNDIILETIEILQENSDDWNESLPISDSKPYFFEDGKDNEVEQLKEELRLNTYATAENCIDELINVYDISIEYTEEEQRILAGIRYEMQLNQFSVSNSYVLAEDISEVAMAKIMENDRNLLGIEIIEMPIRSYTNGEFIPHVIGTVGPLYAEEYATLKDYGYELDDTLGKSGIEKYLEDELRGIDGSREVTVSAVDGSLIEINENNPATAGDTVKLTLDMEYQMEVQEILEDHIERLQSQDEDDLDARGREAQGGAIVVLDVETGAIKALASSPTFDINDYINDYESVASGENNPLVNRAIDGLYRPGSSFKPITAVGLLNEGHITADTHITCNGSYDYYGITMRCHQSWGHGSINVETAIQESCNVFFYVAAQQLGIDKLVEYENAFGLGIDPNTEIGGSIGYLSSPETLDNLGIGWSAGQLLQASIGQSEILITPLQLAMEALTLANKGVLYQPYMVDSIWDYNLETMLYKTEPEIISEIEITEGIDPFTPVIDGMIGAASYAYVLPTVFDYEDCQLLDLPYQTAIKTGSPQNSADTTSSSFIGFYPADDPEIAFAGYVEYGEYSKYMVREIIDAYYGY